MSEVSQSFDAYLGERLGAAYHERLLVWVEELEAIVRELATDCGPPLHPEWGDCPWCEEPGVERSSTDPSTHAVTCTWRKACEWVAAHPEGAGQ